MILSDHSIREELKAGRIVIDPLDEHDIQPSSVDLHIDRYFRVFRNHSMRVIDVKEDQEELTELVEIDEDDPFILHPGEFVLGSTAERVALPNDLVARLEGKSSLGRLGLLIHSSLPGREPVLVLADGVLAARPIEEIVRKRVCGSVVGFDPETFEVGYFPITGWYEGPPDRIFEIRLASGRSVRVTAGHNLFTLDRSGNLVKARTLELEPGARVAIPREVPDPDLPRPDIDVLALMPEVEYPRYVVEGPAIRAAYQSGALATAVGANGQRAGYYHRDQGVVPLDIACQLPWLIDQIGPAERIRPIGGRNSIPAVIGVSPEFAWLLGLYAAEGYRRRHQAVISNTDSSILDRAQAALAELGLPVYRAEGVALSCGSVVFSGLLSWLGIGDGAEHKRLPRGVLGWPRDLLQTFLEGMLDGDGSRDEALDSYSTSSGGLAADLLLLTERMGVRAAALASAGRASDGYKLDRLLDGSLLWDVVVEVRETGEQEPVFDLEVRPDGRRIENFLAGSGGVFVSNTAGFVDAGWDGHLTLELSNVANLPITLYPGMKIGQISFLRMTTPADNPYGSERVGSKYQGQRGPTPSRYFENFR